MIGWEKVRVVSVWKNANQTIYLEKQRIKTLYSLVIEVSLKIY